MEYSEKKKIIIGELTNLYSIPEKIKDLENENENLRIAMGVKAIQYDKQPSSNLSLSRDSKLISMISKIEVNEKIIKKLKIEKNDIRLKFHLEDLNFTEKNVLDAVFTTNSYLEAGKKAGYTKKQIYRIINNIYMRLCNYV